MPMLGNVAILDTSAGQATTDVSVISPFANVQVITTDANAYSMATVTLSAAANGALSNPGIGNLGGNGTSFTVSGTAADIQAALRALVFTPTEHEVAAGDSVTTDFTLSVSDSTGSAMDAITSVVATAAVTAPTITDTSASQIPVASATIQPFAYTTITDPDAGATESTTITLTQNGAPSDAAGTLSGTGLTKTAVGTYVLAAAAVATENTDLQGLVFTSPTPTTPLSTEADIGVTLAVSDGIAAPLTATSTLVLAGNTGGKVSETISSQTTTVYNDTPSTSTTQDYATTIEAVLNGATVVYDQSFDLPYSDPTVQTAVAQAKSALANAAATAGAPAETASNLTTISSQTSTSHTSSSTSAPVSSDTQTYGPSTLGPDVSSFSATPTSPDAYFVVESGQKDININTAMTTTISRTVATTSTDLLTQQYIVAGTSTPTDAYTPGGTQVAQPTNDATALSPFANVTITDAANPVGTATVTLSAANGALSNLGGGTLGANGLIYTVTGIPAALQAALAGLVFTPTDHEVPPGSTATTGFQLGLSDGTASASDSTTSVIATALETAPSLGGTQSGQMITDRQTIQPFAGVTIADPDDGAAETTTITLSQNGTASDAGGTLSGAGLTDRGAGTYMLATASPAAEQAALRALVFTPAAGQVMLGNTVTTTAALTVSDGTLSGQNGATTIGVVQAGTGSAVGDVHMVTLTGQAYGFQAAGDFTLVQATAPGDSFDVQIRTAAYAGATSVVVQAAVRLGPDAVGFALDGVVAINGIADTALNSTHPVQALAGGTLTSLGEGAYSLDWATGEHLTVTNQGSYLDLQVMLPSTDAPGAVRALLGDLATSGSDLALADGDVLPQLDAATLAELAQSWAVGPASLLDGGTVALTAAMLTPATPSFIEAATPGAVLTGSLGRAAGSPGTVIAGTLAALSGSVIANFAAGDLIDALGVQPGTVMTYKPTPAGGTLMIGSAAVAIDGPAPGTTLFTSSDGTGGTLVRWG